MFEVQATIPETFQIKVLSITGQKFRINVCAPDPVLAVLITLGNYLHLPPKNLQLVFKYNTYTSLSSHHRTIISYGVRPGDTLHLQLTSIKSGPICFVPSASAPPEETQQAESDDMKLKDESVPTVAWSDTPAAKLVSAVSLKRRHENQQLRKRMSEIRSKLERRKCLRRASIGTN
ncbi:hypothetical protein SARC_09767 [Sphaeroforma arctica JP610]|uniref:Ubiquitin-like domain-containing protein n=1 Tax=Sphaeroforma arctica JP610 TaxID=667725 RepID=A0A0L0FMP9_9EUKA|nr:hypothetical protein SARC_09767 [Sphaeroforma arctica JP610]KNC77781.1 hypothetical protein SARC_09767 [Sphaeroforma arctica JP610]|eukprot:XP_014151683.1 hypothetical protein SARC_09767 [Sphaeroforma arctica JP610]